MAVEPAVAAAHLAARARAERAVASARAERLRALFPQAAAALRGLGAREVWAFGSLVWGEPHEESDVDLAVSGVSAEAFVAALGELARIFPCDVDLVSLERIGEGFATRIRTEGVAL